MDSTLIFVSFISLIILGSFVVFNYVYIYIVYRNNVNNANNPLYEVIV